MISPCPSLRAILLVLAIAGIAYVAGIWTAIVFMRNDTSTEE